MGKPQGVKKEKNQETKIVTKEDARSPDLILSNEFIEFIALDDSVVESAKLKEDTYRIFAKDWAKKHKRYATALGRGEIPKQKIISLAKLYGREVVLYSTCKSLEWRGQQSAVKAVWNTGKSSGCSSIASSPTTCS